MPRGTFHIGLKGAIFGSFTLALLLILGTLFYLVPERVEQFLMDELEAKGWTIVRDLERKLASEDERHPDATISGLLHQEADRDIRLVGYATDTGEVRARSTGAGKEIDDLAQRLRQQGFHSRTLLPGGDLALSDSVPTPDAQKRYLIVQVRGDRVAAIVDQVRWVMLYAFVPGVLAFLLLGFAVLRAFVLRPLDSMLVVARKLSESDLTGKVRELPAGELGTLSSALNRISESLRDTLGRVRGVSDGVAQVIEQLSRTGGQVSSGATTTLSRVEETSSSMAEMIASLRGIAENVEVLYQSAEESSSSIMEMAATNDEVAENVQAMAGSVEETTSAIGQMTFSIKEVAKNIEDLYASTEQTSSSISEMDHSISQVETNANETAKLSELVTQDADTGVEALQKTIAGIDKIKASSRQASDVIESLGRRIDEIGNILNVIDDVAEQTNLLALNAAIIAAQAGEHGKGFAVVAEEIKDLAERTGASTKEIAELIRAVQDESRNAVSAMNHGVRNVDEGVQLGREAQTALKKIADSANKSTMMVKAIARATVEQARGSKQVTEAIHRIVQTVQQISKATNEQAKGSEQIMKSAERMKTITTHVQRSSQEQSHGSKQITRSIENINEMLTHLNRAQKEQMKGSEQVLAAVETIKSVSEQQTRSVRQLEEALDALAKQGEVLRAEVRRFRV